ncbi:phosphoribosylformylglycinamidine synthase subunit PurQ [archaeon]|nr:phosphoribosylformylglycinamidine synthase subunit PurQ [archaeon]
MYKVGVVIFPGSNCEQETIRFLQTYKEFEVSTIWHKETSVPKLDMYVLPGGFSYGDYLRAGILGSLSPVMNDIEKYANDGRKVLGICNGFQILCERKILSGVLRKNINSRFICKNVMLYDNHLTRFTVPIAHGEGRYYNEDFYSFEVAYRYSPPNDNGSLHAIAGIYNNKFNVLGMMPHPERAYEEHHESQDGYKIMNRFLEK